MAEVPEDPHAELRALAEEVECAIAAFHEETSGLGPGQVTDSMRHGVVMAQYRYKAACVAHVPALLDRLRAAEAIIQAAEAWAGSRGLMAEYEAQDVLRDALAKFRSVYPKADQPDG